MDTVINILSIADNVKTLGPGNRFVIWVQGCPFNCKGCITPEGIPLEVNKLIPIHSIVEEIVINPTLTGVTLSGGEPFLQASKLHKLIREIKKVRNDLDYICFTGYEFEKLDWPEAQSLIGELDLVIDGKYIEKNNNNKGLRGSTNQNFIFLTDKLKKYHQEFVEKERNLEIRINNKYIQTIGIPNENVKI